MKTANQYDSTPIMELDCAHLLNIQKRNLEHYQQLLTRISDIG